MKPRSVILAILGVTAAFVAGYGVARRVPSAAAAATSAGPNKSESSSAKPSRNPALPPPATEAMNATASGKGGAARDILTRITALKISLHDPRSIRQLLLELEALRGRPDALPTLSAFLATGQDADYDSAFGKITLRDGKVPTDFAVPPSLRLALLETIKNIGGPAAQELLARELKTTGRGVEVAYITAALEELAPGQYRESSLAAARDLLAMPLTAASKSQLDRSDREYLYGVLAAAGDRSQVAQAQTQLLLPDGRVDRGALRYLQQTLGEDAVAVAVRAWDDPRVPPNQKEPLARVALTYVGRSELAEQLYRAAINDPAMSPKDRQNLIEDLNQDGFPKQLTPADLPLIEKRLALIGVLAPQATDSVNIAAFAEARKDLLAMRTKATNPAKPGK